jgi:hypothetical protein
MILSRTTVTAVAPRHARSSECVEDGHPLYVKGPLFANDKGKILLRSITTADKIVSNVKGLENNLFSYLLLVKSMFTYPESSTVTRKHNNEGFEES